ncbi:hypothetical protein LTR62_000631 [Meristemomyces frigidus]|uniref:Diphthamide biosynthesis protein 4 n=1 Tax=Meristemomyces frigidus TaxID=1508187 RepID=A0AAN7THJ8_9PEZI|nr:hypothetical protein LTR62_000631 [Meristemomyces frigidus]
MSDYYEILGLMTRQRDAAILDPGLLKRAYRQALLRHHPDKGGVQPGTQARAHGVTVDEISLAYKTLSDPKARAEYDRLHRHEVNVVSGRVHRTGLESVDLDSLDYREESQIWTRSCRCGDTAGFVVTESELEHNIDEGELTVGCKGCSLWLRVLYSAEEDGGSK